MGRPKHFNREGVLEKALPVFWRRGFAQASLHELEVATGVNKSGLYSEFKDKEDLFMQSLQYYLGSLEKRGLLTTEPLGWNNIERFLKMGPCSMEGQKGCFAVSSMREFAILPPEAVGSRGFIGDVAMLMGTAALANARGKADESEILEVPADRLRQALGGLAR